MEFMLVGKITYICATQTLMHQCITFNELSLLSLTIELVANVRRHRFCQPRCIVQ
jgi:hypothetical protein